MRPMLALLVTAALAAVATGCSNDDDEPGRIGRIDGPARVDPEFGGDVVTDDRSDSGG